MTFEIYQGLLPVLLPLLLLHIVAVGVLVYAPVSMM